MHVRNHQNFFFWASTAIDKNPQILKKSVMCGSVVLCLEKNSQWRLQLFVWFCKRHKNIGTERNFKISSHRNQHFRNWWQSISPGVKVSWSQHASHTDSRQYAVHWKMWTAHTTLAMPVSRQLQQFPFSRTPGRQQEGESARGIGQVRAWSCDTRV
jgi:hypothetical protein